MSYRTPERTGRTVAALMVAGCCLATGAAAQVDFDELAVEVDAKRRLRGVPGAALAIVQEGRVAFARGFGTTQLQDGRPVNTETIFPIGSLSKAFTATLIALLVRDGRLSWDDRLRDRLPAFRAKTEQVTAALTLRDLLAHRSGFSRMELAWANPDLELADFHACVRKAVPYVAPRKEFAYSNVNYILLGDMLRASGIGTWEQLLEKRLLGPLGMKSSTAGPPERADWPARGHSVEPEGTIPDWGEPHAAMFGPAGGMHSNLVDLCRWMRFLLGGGELDGKRLLTRKELRATWRPQISDDDGEGYALGWRVSFHGRDQVVLHEGAYRGCSAYLVLVPRRRVGFVLLMNAWLGNMPDDVREIVLDALLPVREKPRRGPQDATERPAVAGLLGQYVTKRKDYPFEVFEWREGLWIEFPDEGMYELVPTVRQGLWRMRSDPEHFVQFVLGDGGVATELRSIAQGAAEVARRRAREKDLPTVAALLKLRRDKAVAGFEEAFPRYRARGTVERENAGLVGRVLELGQGVRRYRSVHGFGRFGKIENVAAGDRGAWWNSNGHRRPMPGNFLLDESRIAFAGSSDWAKLYPELTVVRRDEIDGTAALVLRAADGKNPPRKLWVGAADGRLVLTEFFYEPVDGACGVDWIWYRRYKRFGGLLLPSVVESDSDEGEHRVEYATVEKLESIEPRVFAPDRRYD